MKEIDLYITEKLNINKNRYSKHKDYTINYIPETTKELCDIIIEVVKERGSEPDLNDIDISKLTDLSNLFLNKDDTKSSICRQVTIDNVNVSNWDVSNVTNMESMFQGLKKFNCDLSYWDVSNVTNMKFMFAGCEEFNCNLRDWDISNVKSFRSMFANCKNFDCDLSCWNIKNAENFDYMFYGCKKIKGDYNKWDLSEYDKLKDRKPVYMFYDTGLPKSKWPKGIK